MPGNVVEDPGIEPGEAPQVRVPLDNHLDTNAPAAAEQKEPTVRTQTADAGQFSRIFLFLAFGLAAVMTLFGLFSHNWWAVGFGVFVMIGTLATYFSGERGRKAVRPDQRGPMRR